MSEASYRLVIADDHPLFRGALRAAVSGQFAGAEIAEAGAFDDVVGELERGGEVDLVLLDLAMPEMGGEETLRRLREISPDVPILLTTGYSGEEALRRLRSEGLAGFIQKPYSSRALASKLKEAREHPREM